MVVARCRLWAPGSILGYRILVLSITTKEEYMWSNCAFTTLHWVLIVKAENAINILNSCSL